MEGESGGGKVEVPFSIGSFYPREKNGQAKTLILLEWTAQDKKRQAKGAKMKFFFQKSFAFLN